MDSEKCLLKTVGAEEGGVLGKVCEGGRENGLLLSVRYRGVRKRVKR